MLRRIADSLFWAARYLERAEWRARLVSVNHNLLIEGPAPAGNPWSSMLAISGDQELFEKHYENVDEMSVLTFFVLDERNPSSIRSCIDAAREKQTKSLIITEKNIYLSAISPMTLMRRARQAYQYVRGNDA